MNNLKSQRRSYGRSYVANAALSLPLRYQQILALKGQEAESTGTGGSFILY
ncbi:hypothetical protein [Nostoc sp.]|uniref:hypothetical protein n=1 Tax=Nostoc sp. TaxID=1180 RepID=UPI002FF929E6